MLHIQGHQLHQFTQDLVNYTQDILNYAKPHCSTTAVTTLQRFIASQSQEYIRDSQDNLILYSWYIVGENRSFWSRSQQGHNQSVDLHQLTTTTTATTSTTTTLVMNNVHLEMAYYIIYIRIYQVTLINLLGCLIIIFMSTLWHCGL